MKNKKIKKILLFTLLIITASVLCSTALFFNENRIITGHISDISGEPLVGVSILIKGTAIQTISDIDGNFEIEIPEGDVVLVISFTGFVTKETGVEEKSKLEIVMEVVEVLQTITIVGRPTIREIKRDDKTGMKRNGKSIRKGDFDASTMILERRLSSKDVSYSMRMKKKPVGYIEGKKVDLRIESGTLTAGEWNDLNNWDDWKSLLKDKDFSEMESYWGFKMKDRFSVFVTNKYELPIVDCIVTLKDKSGKIVWESRTDNVGKAELWNGIFSTKRDEAQLYIEIEHNRKIHKLEGIHKFEDGVNHLQINEECNSSKNVDILFVVDATGSMADEIQYLKKELEDVVSRVKAVDRGLNFRLGSVFFRDSGDEYITKQSPLSRDISRCINFFKSNGAAGGGDYPEAVHEGMEEAIMQDWSASAMARIIFLVLDAPAHHKPDVIEDLHFQIKEAARLGIKIIPVTASGINRQTEFLMKFFSLSTNGTYVFLTDDSGVGEKHLTPLVHDYKVEKLNDLLVRLISNFTKSRGCSNQQQSDNWTSDVKLYPNPTSNFINIFLEEKMDKLLLRSASGMIVHTMNNIPAGETRIDMQSLVDGVYTVQLIKDEKSVSMQIILIH